MLFWSPHSVPECDAFWNRIGTPKKHAADQMEELTLSTMDDVTSHSHTANSLAV